MELEKALEYLEPPVRERVRKAMELYAEAEKCSAHYEKHGFHLLGGSNPAANLVQMARRLRDTK